MRVPEGLTKLGEYALSNIGATQLIIPSTVQTVYNNCFRASKKMKKILFMGKVTSMGAQAFTGCTALTDIYVAWNQAEVTSVPWGATSATIHYLNEGWMDEIESILGS